MEKMFTTFVLTVIILFICVALMSVKILLKKGGRFPNMHIEGNAALRAKGIHCAKTLMKEDGEHKNPYDKIVEINNNK